MFKRTTCFLLALMMLLSAAACGETPNQSESEDTTETTPSPNTQASDPEAETEQNAEETLSEEELRRQISDDLPEVTYDGASYRVMVFKNSINDFVYEIYSEEMTGDSLNDAVYMRNLAVEDRFDVSIQHTPSDNSYEQPALMARADSYEQEIVGLVNHMMYSPINAKAVLNWTTVPHVNLDKPWHNKLANDSATINGILYGICSDLAISSMTYTFAIFFNMDLMERYGHTSQDLYSLVREGNWTMDKMIEILSPIYEDTDGNGQRDITDVYGFGYSLWTPADVWLAAFDQPICTVTPENTIELSFYTDKTVQILEKLLDWHYNNDSFYCYPSSYGYAEEDYFAAGTLAMAPLRFNAAYHALRNMEQPYSILPYPKWNEAQEQYLTNADDKFTAFCIPKPAGSNLDFVGTIYEALSAESYKSVYPIYYDEALKGRYSEEPETAEMVDLIMAGRNFDFSFEFGMSYFQNLPYMIRNMLQNNNGDLASEYRKISKAISKSIETKLLPLYESSGS